jgi:hypothetical protein
MSFQQKSSWFALTTLLTVASGCGAAPRDKPQDPAKGQVEGKGAGNAKADDPKAATGTLLGPAKIDHLLDIVPEDASVVVSIDSKAFLKTNSGSHEGAARDLANVSGLPVALIDGLINSLEESVFFARREENAPVKTSPFASACLGVRMKSEERFDSLLSHFGGKRQPDGRIEWQESATAKHGVWIGTSRTGILCTKAEVFDLALRTAGKTNPSFQPSVRVQGGVSSNSWGFADLNQVIPQSGRTFARGSYIVVSLEPNARSNIRFVGRGDIYPHIADVLAPMSHPQLSQFPRGPLALLGLSLVRSKGKTLADLMPELERSGQDNLAEQISKGLSETNLAWADLESTVGDGLAVGVYIDPAFTSKPEEYKNHFGALVALRTSNEAVAQQTLQKMLAGLKKSRAAKKDTKFTADSMSVDLGKGEQAVLERKDGAIVLSIGEAKFAAELRKKFGQAKESIAGSGEFEDARNRANPSHILGYVDVSSLGKLTNANLGDAFQIKPQLMTLGFEPVDGGLGFSLRADLSAIGVASALGIYGVNRYLKSAKTTEAKLNIGRITRGAIEAYELERDPGPNLHMLCKSAVAVPSEVPSGRKYVPSAEAGRDFQTGDRTTGWRCLRFSTDTPTYYQYEYRAGGNYKGPARGGPDPGPNGFEVSAEGDLDGDGKTSLFTLVGKVKNGSIERSTTVFISDEFE